MEPIKKIYEGKAKQMFTCEDEHLLVMHFKDDASAFNGVKKAKLKNKGVINNKISALIYEELIKEGIPTHFVKVLNEREQLVRKIKIFPLEIIVRNVVAGSMSERLDVEEGTLIPNTVYELCYKNDRLNDPLINEHHAVALGLATYEDLKVIYDLSMKINVILKRIFDSIGITLVDFKVEFGKDENDQIVLADELSPDTCRFWDNKTKEKLDKDRFRRDMGDIIPAYEEILRRLENRK